MIVSQEGKISFRMLPAGLKNTFEGLKIRLSVVVDFKDKTNYIGGPLTRDSK